jgi:hypothetical protein
MQLGGRGRGKYNQNEAKEEGIGKGKMGTQTAECAARNGLSMAICICDMIADEHYMALLLCPLYTVAHEFAQ